MHLRRFIFISCLLTVVSALAQPLQSPPFTLEEYDRMSVEQRRKVFDESVHDKLQDRSQLINLHWRGVQDPDPEVQLRATASISALAIGLQGAKARGLPNPFDMSKFTQIQQLLVGRLPTADANMEAVIVYFLPFSTAPNPSLENTLLNQLERVQAAFPANTADRASDEFIKADIAQGSNKRRQRDIIYWMSLAGYDSERFKQLVLGLLDDPTDHNGSVRAIAAEAVGALRPLGGLERLADAVRKFPETPEDFDAMAAYGTAALPYVPLLEEAATNPKVRDDIQKMARKAIAQIRDPSLRPPSKRLPKAVSLVDAGPDAMTKAAGAPPRGPAATPVGAAGQNSIRNYLILAPASAILATVIFYFRKRLASKKPRAP